MDGIHDLGGMHGFGAVVVRSGPVFKERWEGRVHAMLSLALGAGVSNTDKFRHAIERLPPLRYLSFGYYERWLAALETILVEDGVLLAGELDECIGRLATAAASVAGGSEVSENNQPHNRSSHRGAKRPLARPPRFAVGQSVLARTIHPPGHTRLPRYVRGKRGVVGEIYPSFVFPDTNAHDLGEQPQHVYAVVFAGEELWGEESEPGTRISVDLFESYLEAIDD